MAEPVTVLHEHVVGARKRICIAEKSFSAATLVNCATAGQPPACVDKPLIVSARPNLRQCPTEIMSEIASYLDLFDVLRLRQVSHRMDAVTRLRPIWERLAVEHEGTALLYKRLNLCTSEELERLVQRVKAGLEPTSAEWTTVRSPKLQHAHLPYLTPGGRWFLTTPIYGCSAVLYADLENPDAAWQTLIPKYDTPVQYSLISCEHVVGTPALTIHLALAVGRSFLPSESREPVDNHRTDVHEISVWRVSPTFDDDGLIDGLHADRISLFHPAKGLDSMRIQGEHLIFTLGRPSSVCTVVCWVEANNCVDYPRQLVYHPHCRIAQILTGNFLLVGCTRITAGGSLSLWDLSLIPVYYSDEDSVAARTPLWREATSNILSHWPPPWVANGFVYQIIPKDVGMLIMALPLGSTSTSLPDNLLSVFEADHGHTWLGISSSQGVVAYTEVRLHAPDGESRKPFIVLRINNHYGRPSFALQQFDIPFPPNRFYPMLDVYSSRLVLYGYSDVHLCSLSEIY